ncbi:sulfurtransferase TusA family protein [Streptomyces sp. NPDC058773]|uniref:sulfurtransferase TusA family protein n=1 Tax=Streptomyces sp. NPDC058773 TaxID=3346632 RepID=UPI0036AEA0EB
MATDPAAPLDLPAWCHMTGHHYLGPVLDDLVRDVPENDAPDRGVYALRLSADARPTRPAAPWRAARPGPAASAIPPRLPPHRDPGPAVEAQGRLMGTDRP